VGEVFAPGRAWAWANGLSAALGAVAFLANSSLVFHDSYVYSQLPILYREAIEKLGGGVPSEALAPEERQALLVQSFSGSFDSVGGVSERRDGRPAEALFKDVALDAFGKRHGPSFWGPSGYRERQLASFLFGFLAFGPYALIAIVGRLRGRRPVRARSDWD